MAERIHIGFLIYPDVTQLDATGPAQVLSLLPGAAIHFVWKTRELVPTDAGFSIAPTDTCADCPALDILCVPGGPGQRAIMTDTEILEFLSRQGKQARYVTSVCSGSLLLGAAGLMQGYRAGAHWAFRHLLPEFGAHPVAERVVIDRNRITGGGVTAGIDFGLTLAAELFGSEVAREIQLLIEYNPEPPFDAGTPELAGSALAEKVRRRLSDSAH